MGAFREDDVRRAQAGDRDAFARLIDAALPELIARLRRLVPEPAVEDVVQDVCLHALIGLPNLRRPELFGPWLGRVAFNRAMQWLRRSYSQETPVVRTWEPAEADGWGPVVSDPAEAVAAKLDAQDLLDLLGPDARDAFVLRYVEGWTAEAIARVQGTVAGTVRWRLHQSRRKLRAALGATEPPPQPRPESTASESTAESTAESARESTAGSTAESPGDKE